MPPAPALPDGHRIGSFELQSAWHRSGTGLVYRAWDHALVRAVAIKEYLPAAWARRDARGEVHPFGPGTTAEFERGLHAFVDEARTLAHCDHPSLVRVLELLQAHGTAYRVMPWYGGCSLLDLRRKMNGPIGEPALRSLLDDLLGALEAYQRVGDVHRGIDPSQVLLPDADRAMLLGPGAASRAAQAAAPTAGSEADYAPPEQAHPGGQAQGPWTDFYALAGVARFCITGEPPRTAGAAAPEPLAATIERLFGQQRSLRWSAPLLHALDAAMSADIARRPQSAAQFRDSLLGTPRPPEATLAASMYNRVDGATQALIRRVVDSIDEPVEVAPGPAQGSALRPAPDAGDGDMPTLHTFPPDRADEGARRTARPPRRRFALRAGLALAAVAAVGLGTLANQEQPLAFSGARVPQIAMPQVAERLAATTPPPSPLPVPPAAVPQRDMPLAPALSGPGPGAEPSEASLVIAKAQADPTARASAPAEPPAVKDLAAARALAAGPRQECGARTAFSLYRCMQQQCSLAKWQRHLQCLQLESSDGVE
jgi:non-specific serine/threonine protein kinase